MTEPVRVLVVDDEELVRSGLRALLESDPQVLVVGLARDGGEGCELVATTSPDVVLMDMRMPLVDGLTATRRMRTTHPQVAVVMLTTFGTEADVLPALRAGASGYLLKNSSAAALIDAVRRAARGESVLDPSVAGHVVSAAVGAASVAAPLAGPPLTAREQDVLRLLAKGQSNTEIARELVVEVATVKSHVARVLTKLGARDRTQAVVAAYELGIIRPQGDWAP